MLGDKTLLQKIIENELEKFQENSQISYTSIKTPLDLDTGSVVFEVNSASNAFQKLLTNDFKTRVASYTGRDTSAYREQLGNRIIKLDLNCSLSHALDVAYETYKKIPEIFAGILLLTPSGAIINPLHPLVSLELLKVSTELTVSKLLVFTYKNLDSINLHYSNASDELKEQFKTDINTLIQIYQSQIKNRAIKVLETNSYSERRIKQKYQIGKYKNEDDTKEYFIAVHQLLTKGTFVPYYGASLISMNSITSGFHLSPFKSCNISSHTSTEPASVCTGSTSNKTIRGLRTLHHANLSSPYQTYCMSNVAKTYADICIDISFKIFKQANLIKKD